ncbi:TPA: hypothetical protein ACG1UU_002026 [Kluyvera ascorbata]
MLLIKAPHNYTDELGNKIFVGDGVKANKLFSIIFMESGSSIRVGKNTNLADSTIRMGKNSSLVLGENCTLKGKISIGSFSSVVIGHNLDVTDNLYIRVVEATSLHIGDDCLIASDVIIRTNDGHPIYDLTNGKRINKGKNIIIGRHVWLGEQAAILKGVTVNDGSIIAMRSLVTKDVPATSIVAGVPARLIRRNCTWEHSLTDHTAEYYHNALD